MCDLLLVSSYFRCRAVCTQAARSIIEVTDGTLPKKPCRTCKNRFHASCLYKVGLEHVSEGCLLTTLSVVQHEPFVKLPTVPL
jgi:hypothetical protein